MPLTKAAIAADSPLTAAAGARIAREGGNAVDIAVSAALTAAVAEPLMCSLGGSGFFMVRPPGKPAELIEGADAMPTVKQRPTMDCSAWRTTHLPYGDGIEVQTGHASVAVPGVLAAAELAWKRHGRLPWREVVQPALEVARGAIPTSQTLARWLSLVAKLLFWQQPECRQCFFRDGKHVLKESETFRIPNLDVTLEAIAEQGARTLYDGDLAATFAREIQQGGGFVSRDDLSAYQAVNRMPTSLQSGGFELALNPPPAVGGAAVGCLIKIVESNWRKEMTAAEWALLQAHAQSRLLQVRENEISGSGLDDRAVTALFADAELRKNSMALKSPNTTHLSVMTTEAGMAAVTMSMGYGAGVILPSLGICCNNSLGEPELNPQGYHTSEPGTRLVSNMAPTLAWHDDGRCVAFGSPGASRITTSMAQAWIRFAMEGLTFEQGVEAPRLHIESFADGLRAQFEPGIDATLLKDEFNVRPFDAPDMYFGAVKLAAIDRAGQLHAIADERRHGAVEFVG